MQETLVRLMPVLNVAATLAVLFLAVHYCGVLIDEVRLRLGRSTRLRGAILWRVATAVAFFALGAAAIWL